MADLQTYKWANWVDVKNNDVLDVYDTNDPTPIGTWEDGIEATYRFLDEEGNVLDSWTCKDWETPVYKGETPTKEHYHFTWWSPALGPIYVNTDYTPQFEEDLYTVTLADLLYFDDDIGEFVTWADWGTVNKTSVQVPYGTICSAEFVEREDEEDESISGEEMHLNFNRQGTRSETWELLDTIVIRANDYTAQYRYGPSWYDEDTGSFTDFNSFTVEENCTIEWWTIMRAAQLYGIAIDFDSSMWSVNIDFLDGLPYGTPISANANVLTVWQWADATEITATPGSWYVFAGWWDFPATVTWELTITANFEADWGWEK